MGKKQHELNLHMKKRGNFDAKKFSEVHTDKKGEDFTIHSPKFTTTHKGARRSALHEVRDR